MIPLIATDGMDQHEVDQVIQTCSDGVPALVGLFWSVDLLSDGCDARVLKAYLGKYATPVEKVLVALPDRRLGNISIIKG